MVQATYTTGSAILTIARDGTTETVHLDEVAAGSQLMSMLGGTVVWRNSDGWVVQLMAYDPTEMGGGMFAGAVTGQVTIQRINDHNFWTTQDHSIADRCILSIDELSKTAVKGSATCKGLRWLDGVGLSGGMGFGSPPYIEDEEPFDLEATFEAMP